MPRIPVKAEYGPTLGELVSPRWRAASRRGRVLVGVTAIALVALVLAAVLGLLNAQLAHRGPPPFSTQYRGLNRTAPDPGYYAKLVRYRHGRLADSFAVAPLRVEPYRGDAGAVLPLYASDYLPGLAQHTPGFVLHSESKTLVNAMPAYAIGYSTQVAGRLMYARDVLVLPPHAGARDGAIIRMVSTPSRQIYSPLVVGGSGVLYLPLHSFSFG